MAAPRPKTIPKSPPSRLSLTTDAQHEFVKIDGALYPLRNLDDLEMQEYRLLGRLSPRIETLWAKDETTEEETAELRAALDRICRVVLEAPADVQVKLKDIQRLMVLRTFTALSGPTVPKLARALETTGTGSSRG